MKKDQAYQVLVDAINVATTKGAFNLQDVSTILAALQALKPEEEMTVLKTLENDN
jgi:ribosomal protein S7